MSLRDLIDQAMTHLEELDRLPPPASGIGITQRVMERSAIEERVHAMLRVETEMAMLRPPAPIYLLPPDEEIPITRMPDPHPVYADAQGNPILPRVGDTIHVRKPQRFRGAGAEIEPLFELFQVKFHLVSDQDKYSIGPGAEITTEFWPEGLVSATANHSTAGALQGEHFTAPLEIVAVPRWPMNVHGVPTQICCGVGHGSSYPNLYFWPIPRVGERVSVELVFEGRRIYGSGIPPETQAAIDTLLEQRKLLVARLEARK